MTLVFYRESVVLPSWLIHLAWVAASLLSLVLPLCGQESARCSDYGAAIFCSNGLSAIRSGTVLYFSDGTTVTQSGNNVYINTNTQANRDYAAYSAGQALGTAVGAVIADVRQRRKFERVCDYDPYAQGWVMGRPTFCSVAAIRDACPQMTDFSGFKYVGDTPHHITWTQEGVLSYLPNWPHGFEGEVPCVPDAASHATHEASTWLANFHEAQSFLPGKNDDDIARVVVWLRTHPGDYQAGHKAEMYKNLSDKLLGRRS